MAEEDLCIGSNLGSFSRLVSPRSSRSVVCVTKATETADTLAVGDALAGGVDNDLMVFSPRSAQLESIDDQWLNNRVRVIGTVLQMGVVELKRELEWDLTPEIEREFKADKPVLIAHRFERIR